MVNEVCTYLVLHPIAHPGRLGTQRPEGWTPTIQSVNGLIFQSRRFRAACRDYRLNQEFVTPYTPEQNGMIEWFIRTAKEELFWQYNLEDTDEAFRRFAEWIDYYHEQRRKRPPIPTL